MCLCESLRRAKASAPNSHTQTNAYARTREIYQSACMPVCVCVCVCACLCAYVCVCASLFLSLCFCVGAWDRHAHQEAIHKSAQSGRGRSWAGPGRPPVRGQGHGLLLRRRQKPAQQGRRGRRRFRHIAQGGQHGCQENKTHTRRQVGPRRQSERASERETESARALRRQMKRVRVCMVRAQGSQATHTERETETERDEGGWFILGRGRTQDGVRHSWRAP
jgi:hypothetical protein